MASAHELICFGLRTLRKPSGVEDIHQGVPTTKLRAKDARFRV